MLLPTSERRKHRRDLSCDLIRLEFKTNEAGQQSTFGVVEDVSAAGCLVVVDLVIPVGVHVKIDTADARIEAVCRHCNVRQDRAYLVGLELTDTNAHNRAAARERRWNPEF